MTAEVPGRGWWRRRKADTRDESPWPAEFLGRLNLELETVRRQARRKVRPLRRRLALKAPEVDQW